METGKGSRERVGGGGGGKGRSKKEGGRKEKGPGLTIGIKLLVLIRRRDFG